MNTVAEDPHLPSLREDLQLLPGPEAYDGSPTWNIVDPVRNQYFRIGWIAFELISRWSSGRAIDLLKKVKKETVCQVTIDDIKEFIQFLSANGLTILPVSGNSYDYVEQHKKSRKTWLSWLIQHYLFIRIPLIKPDKLLRSTLTWVEPLYSRSFFYFIICLGFTGLYLVSRQWDVFVNSFLYLFNLNGLILYIIALALLKIFHELGHAYTASRYGCKISSIGVAFLVMFPVLYTDTSDAWKIKSRKKRLAIDCAGIVTELYIACIATFVWVFLPDGILRSVVFVLATASWLISLTINLNPFMRFDGYYLLSDLWNIENLQSRAFQLGKWRMRELLFNLGLPMPGNFTPKIARRLVWYAWLTWLYRFFLFLGIALLVYYFFFKLLGIILFIIEIFWFILMPVYREIALWWQMKSKIVQSKRYVCLLLLFLGFIGVLFIPWNSTVHLPAIFESTDNVRIYTPVRGQIKEILVTKGEQVTKGQLLLRLDSPILFEELNRVEKQLNILQTKINRLAASRDELSNIHIHLSHLEQLTAKKKGLLKKINLLEIRSPMSGKLIDVAQDLHVHRWINQSTPLMNIIDENHHHVIAFLAETELARVELNQAGKFYAENPQYPAISLLINDVEQSNLKYLDNYYFHHQYGGEVATRQNADGRYIPENAIYKVTLTPVDNYQQTEFVLRGTVHIEARAESLFRRISNLVLSVLIRETGF